MGSQAYLDHLLAQHISGEQEGFPIAEQIAAMLAAAKRLFRLQEMALPPGLAHRVEVCLRTPLRHRSRQVRWKPLP